MKKSKQYVLDDFELEEDENFVESTIMELCFSEKVEQLSSDDY